MDVFNRVGTQDLCLSCRLGISLLVLFSVMLWTPIPRANAVEPEHSFDLVLEGIRAGKSAVYSGEYRGTEVTRSPSADGGAPLVLKETLYCAFDFHGQQIRFDRFPEGKLGGQFARTPEKMSILPRGHTIASVHAAGEVIPDWVKPLDIRTVGLAFPIDLEHFVELEKVLSAYQGINTVREDVVKDGVVEVEMTGTYKQGSKNSRAYRRIVRFDPKKSHFVLHMSHQRGPLDSINDPSLWHSPVVECTVVPIEVSGEWVPRSIKIRNNDVVSEYALQWISVNQQLDEKVFSIDGFELKNADLITDSRLGRSIVVRNLTEERMQKPKASWSPFLPYIAAATVVIGVTAGLLLWIRRRKST